MQRRDNILRAHYTNLLRKTTSWMGLFAIIAMLFSSLPASAGQLTGRSVTLGSSKPTGPTTFTVSWKPSVTTSVKFVRISLCSSPLNGTCAAVASSTVASATFTTGAPTSGVFSGFSVGSGAAAPTATSVYLGLTTGTGALVTSTTYTIQLANVTLPNTANTQFYAQIQTFSDFTAITTIPSAPIDFGAAATSTGTELTVQANVQESLQFAVGQTGACGSISGSTVNIGNNPGTDNVLPFSNPATAGTSVMCIATNAATGYVISYISNSTGGTNGAFTNTTGATHDFTDNSSGSTFAAAIPTQGAAEYFGMNIRANTGTGNGPTAGANVSGGTAPTAYGAAYGTAGTFGWTRNTFTTLVSETTGATTNTLYTVTYAAQAAVNTPTGAYNVKVNYVATGTF